MSHNNSDWVVMPCYNEEQHISSVIDDVLKHCSNLIVIDDGSIDSTYKIAKAKNDSALRHIINLGKGAAMKTGIEYAISQGAKKIVFIDADGQHESKEIPKFFRLLDEYDIVFGSRKLDKNMPGVLRLGNRMLSGMISMLFGIKLGDTQSGYRGLLSSAYDKIKWQSTDYSVETEMIANAGKSRLRYKEIKINTLYTNKYKGTTVIDGIKIGIKLIMYKIRGLV